MPTYYYYYDEKNRLTDIVRYNPRARRLLPDYVFEYDEDGRVSTVIIVPETGSDYEKWFYSYYENGLKGQEACYNKRQELQGRIEYQYSFWLLWLSVNAECWMLNVEGELLREAEFERGPGC